MYCCSSADRLYPGTLPASHIPPTLLSSPSPSPQPAGLSRGSQLPKSLSFTNERVPSLPLADDRIPGLPLADNRIPGLPLAQERILSGLGTVAEVASPPLTQRSEEPEQDSMSCISEGMWDPLCESKYLSENYYSEDMDTDAAKRFILYSIIFSIYLYILS